MALLPFDCDQLGSLLDNPSREDTRIVQATSADQNRIDPVLSTVERFAKKTRAAPRMLCILPKGRSLSLELPGTPGMVLRTALGTEAYGLLRTIS